MYDLRLEKNTLYIHPVDELRLQGILLDSETNQIEILRTLDKSWVGASVVGSSIPEGCVITEIEGSTVSLSVVPTKDIKSAKLAVKKPSEPVFTVAVRVTEFNQTQTCRAVISSAQSNKTQSCNLTIR